MKLRIGTSTTLFVLILTMIPVIFNENHVWAEVEILRNPNVYQISFESGIQKILLKTAKANQRYKWSKEGPGEFKDDIEGDGAIFYLIPGKISGDSKKVIIRVESTDITTGAIDTGETSFMIIKSQKKEEFPEGTGSVLVTIEPEIKQIDKFNINVKIDNTEMGIIKYPIEREKNFTDIRNGESIVSVFIGSKNIGSQKVTVNKKSKVIFNVKFSIVSLLFEKADECFKKNQLTSSNKGKSAKDYYDIILEIDPENKAAKDGNRKIADRYFQLAFKRKNKMALINKGLNVYSKHEGLIQLKAQLENRNPPTLITASLSTEEKDVPIISEIEREFMPMMVKLDNFWIGKYEVSFKEYDYYRIKNGMKKWSEVLVEHFDIRYSKTQFFEEEHLKEEMPVTSVTFNEAKEYTNWLTKITGNKYRLPTIKEWEFAARGGDKKHLYPWDDINDACLYANIADQEALKSHPAIQSEKQIVHCNDNFSHVAPCGYFKPNGFNLYDMIGNVSEWVEDEKSKLPVMKGGSFLNAGNLIRIDNNLKVEIEKAKFIGFRVLKEN